MKGVIVHSSLHCACSKQTSMLILTTTVGCIIESVDSVCRDSADTQYMLIQISQNLQNC